MSKSISQQSKIDGQSSSDIIAASRVAFIQAGWHRDIVDRGQRSFIETFVRCGGRQENVEIFHVPGSYEIPLQAKSLALSGAYEAIVGAGLVVNGGIYSHEFVANAVASGLMTVQLQTAIPILTMVLSPLNFHETGDHIDFFKQHFTKKGAEAAQACVETLLNRRALKKGATSSINHE